MPSDSPQRSGITRRAFLAKASVVAGAVSLSAVGGYAAVRSLTPSGPEVSDAFLYLRPEGAPREAWWVSEGLVGKAARLRDFRPGRGANVLWRTALDEKGSIVSGVPALLIQVEEEALEFPEAYPRKAFVIDGLYAVYNLCPHAGCRTSWKLNPVKLDLGLGYELVCCPCHYAHFDPYVVRVFRHPPPPEASGAEYVGISHVAGPVDRGMPLIPIETRAGTIHGAMNDPEWYTYLDSEGGILP